ncbi:hypothetical protein LU631_03155 [Erwinia tracheiphila]|uniref:Chitin-binding type-3 domain-containing protein n=1 Tax=Erwinia tracheiphila TaxID=65700 RepID=A0A0M2KCH5_9GAMM|nr:exochitinase [Erwinia tracheiphila]EOS95294.1 exochitinase [Erwinia tracheiphila PSU-1]KKF37075.1 hypothetical protein SY86_19215 [Erwinia tracheiphila]UIA88442.1 hypothetical protein LU631_03155 [Erwinia tracheiphila]UIA96818.1 hypothetical protein LU633_01830 [Erwinia tracheiphila]
MNGDDVKHAISSGVQSATIALEISAGSRVTLSAVQPSSSTHYSLRYHWHASSGATVSAPNEVETSILMPEVTTVTRVDITLTVTNGRGDIARSSWPVCVLPVNGGSGNNQPDYPLWNRTSTYPGQSRVSHNGGNYQAKWWIATGVEPGLPNTTGPATGNSLPWIKI